MARKSEKGGIKRSGCGCPSSILRAMDLPREELGDYPVRAWMGGHLYPEKTTGTKLNMEALEQQGITDIILNEPECYLI